jgi:hypothetical protein
MSAIKAQAEARRAKILAREKDRLLAAKGEKPFASSPVPASPVPASPAPSAEENNVSVEGNEDVSGGSQVAASPAPSEDLSDVATPFKDRPLAARRNKIKALQEQLEEQGGGISATSASSSDDPPLILPDDLERIRNENTEVKNTKEIVIEKKSIDEINAEVARNTQEFDRTLKIEKKPSSSKDLIKAPKVQPHAMSTDTMMALVRLVLITLVGTFLGYFGGISGQSRIGFSGDTMEADPEVVLLHARLGDGGTGVRRTLSGVFGSPMQCAVLGIIIIWVVASLIKGPLEKMVSCLIYSFSLNIV